MKAKDKNLMKPRVVHCWDGSLNVFLEAQIPLTRRPTKSQLKSIQLMMQQTPVQIDALRALTLEEADSPEHMFDILMACFGITARPAATGKAGQRGRKGKRGR